MAITILENPGGANLWFYRPIFNQIWLAFESDQTAQPRFSYIVYLYNGSVSPSNLITRLKLLPDPDGRCIVDVHKFFESATIQMPTFDVEEKDIFRNTTSNSFFRVQIAEEYESGGTLQEFNLQDLGSDISAFSGVVDWTEQNNFDYYSQFSPVAGENFKFRSSLPKRNYISKLENSLYLDYDGDSVTLARASSVDIKAYNNGGLSWSENLTPTFDFGQLAIGAKNINEATDLSGTNFLDETHTYYTFEFKADGGTNFLNNPVLIKSVEGIDSSTVEWGGIFITSSGVATPGSTVIFSGFDPPNFNGTYTIDSYEYDPTKPWDSLVGLDIITMTKDTPDVPVGNASTFGTVELIYEPFNSGEYRVDLDHTCSKHENYELMYVDRLGSFITLNFDRVSQKSGRITKKDYRKLVGGFDGSRVTYKNSDRTTGRMDTMVDESIRIRSNWISPEMSVLVEEMLASPMIYHNHPTLGYLPINMKTSTYKENRRTVDKIFNYELEFEYTFKDPQQRF